MPSHDVDVGTLLSLSDEECDATREHIESFIRTQVETADLEGAVIGLSGGIDSTLTAHLAVGALGADGVRGLIMPSEVDSAEHMSDAESVAEELDIESDVIEIGPIVEAVLSVVPDVVDAGAVQADPIRTAVGNVRVRARAVLNYFVANADHRLVLGTGNRTEALVGYFTKYGDGAVDCLPIGNLYKGQVRDLARFLDVPERIVTKTPTAGLWAGQADETELGVPYETLDVVLALTVDGPFTPRAAAELLDEVTAADIDRIRSLHERSTHKRQRPPSPPPRR